MRKRTVAGGLAALSLIVSVASVDDVRAGNVAVEIRINDPQSRSVADVAVYLLPAGGLPAVGATGAASTPGTATMDQRDREFVPHILIVEKGTEVQFPNSDNVSHHVYSFSQPNNFEIPLYKGQAQESIRFEHTGLATLGCNIHDRMLGYILVVDSPYFGLTDRQGVTVIEGVSPGTYQVTVWSPRMSKRSTWVADTIRVSGASDLQAYTYRLKDRLNARRNESDGSLSWDVY